jgi:hypothetical protein
MPENMEDLILSSKGGVRPKANTFKTGIHFLIV